MKHLSKILFVLILAVAVVFFVKEKPGKAQHESSPQEARLQIPAEPPQGVGALGRIEPMSRVIELSHDAGPEGARIGELKVNEGDEVLQGDIIAIFSDADRKEARLKAAQARIPALEARISAENAVLSFAKREYERTNAMVKANAISKVRFDEAEKNYRQSTANMEALKAELEQAKAELVLAEEEVKQSVLRSPIDGTILKVMTRPGERVGSEGVALIADLSKLDVVAEGYERDMPRVAMGQKAKIRVPGMEEIFTGEVRELGYLVRKNDLNDTDPLADRDNRIVEVRVGLAPEASEKLRHLLYMQVDVRIM